MGMDAVEIVSAVGEQFNFLSMETNLMLSLNVEAAEKVGDLFSRLGFRVRSFDYRADSFGDSFLCLTSKAIGLWIVRDRGQSFVDIGRPTEPAELWWDLRLVRGHFLGSDQPLKDLSSLGEFVQKNLPDLNELFGPLYATTKERLDRIKKERSDEWVKQFSGLDPEK
jgi:hypothetical protein